MLLISYQNFSSINSKEWDATSSLKIINEMNNFESSGKHAETLAIPQSGSNLQSISNDWMQRQGSILLNGYDKELESAMNEKLNSWVYKITRTETAEETMPNESTEVKSKSAESKKMNQKLRFSRINSLKYDLDEKICMDLTANPGDTRFNLSQSLSDKAKVGIEHRTAGSQTQMFLKYEW
jgi:hypothetical protein